MLEEKLVIQDREVVKEIEKEVEIEKIVEVEKDIKEYLDVEKEGSVVTEKNRGWLLYRAGGMCARSRPCQPSTGCPHRKRNNCEPP